MSDPYPFESDDDIEIRELDLESIDRFADERITVGELVDEQASWRFGHVIVDEAQDLTPMQWRMVMRRVRGRSLTIVGDLAQRTVGPPGEWSEHLPRSLADIDRRDLTINYRSPTEVNELVTGLLEDIAPGVPHSRAIRSSGERPRIVRLGCLDRELGAVVTSIRSEVPGRMAIIAADIDRHVGGEHGDQVDSGGSRWLTPAAAKGLEFDVVVVVEPAEIMDQPGGGAQLYVALTRPTQQLVIVHERPLPDALRRSIPDS